MNTPRLLITGASGLLGKALVAEFQRRKAAVLAHYYQNPGESHRYCQWIQGDFSSPQSIRDFINGHWEVLKGCTGIINNYGPITYKPLTQLLSEDLIHDFCRNVIPAWEIFNRLAATGNIRQVVNILSEGITEQKPYKNILSYAVAKNSLYTAFHSIAEHYPGIRIKFAYPQSLKGAQVKKKGEEVDPGKTAREIADLYFEDRT